MKKVAALFLLACMLLTLIPAAMAAPGDAALFTEDQRKELGIELYTSPSFAAMGDTVYTLWGKEIYAWQVGQEKPTKMAGNLENSYFASYDEAKSQIGDKADTLIASLVSTQDTLYGLNRLTGKLFPLTFANDQVVFGTPIQLDWTGLEQTVDSYTSIRDAYRLSISDGKLYAMFRNNEDYYKPEAACFDLATGAKRVLDIPLVQDFTPYKDGKMLVRIYDMENAYQGGSEPEKPELAIYDPADGSTAAQGLFGDVNVFGLAYQAETDTLFYTTNSKLMAMKGLGPAEQVAYMPVDYADDCPAVMLPGNLYAINTWNGLFVRNTDPQYMPTSSLSIYGGYLDAAAMSFSLQYPQTPVTFNQNIYFDSSEVLAQAMTSGDNSFDIYNFDISYQDFESLVNKGYCADLSASPMLTGELAKIYPFLQSAVQRDGKFYAIPVSMYGYGLSISPKAWEATGLMDKMPTSFMGLIDFFTWWVEEGQEQHPDVQLMQGVMDYGETLFQMALNQYVYYCQAQGQELSFNTPLFRNMMQALEDLDIEKLNETISDDSMEALSMMKMRGGYIEESDVLFMEYGDWLSVYGNGRSLSYSAPLILSLEEGGPKHIPVYLQALFINPNTKNMEMALKYLENALERMEPAQHIMMFPDDNEPIPTENFEQMVEQWQEELDKQKKRLEAAKPEDKKDIETTIEMYEDMIAKKDDYYWSVSKEAIAKYREITPLCYAATPNLLNYRTKDGSSEIGTLIERYRQTQMSLDQFVTEVDKKTRMILLESK